MSKSPKIFEIHGTVLLSEDEVTDAELYHARCEAWDNWFNPVSNAVGQRIGHARGNKKFLRLALFAEYVLKKRGLSPKATRQEQKQTCRGQRCEARPRPAFLRYFETHDFRGT